MEKFEAENAWFTFKGDNPDLFEESWSNYESPISVIMPSVLTQLEVNIEKSVVSAISDLGVSVDKDELVRALQYDREQYEKGYRDGYRTAKEEIVRCKDCKHWWKKNEVCTHPKCCDSFLAVVEAPPEHFCGYGERKRR